MSSVTVTVGDCDEYRGKLRTGILENVAWHDNGSWFLRNGHTMHNLAHASTPRIVQEAFLGLYGCSSLDDASTGNNSVDLGPNIAVRIDCYM